MLLPGDLINIISSSSLSLSLSLFMEEAKFLVGGIQNRIIPLEEEEEEERGGTLCNLASREREERDDKINTLMLMEAS